MIGLSLSLSIGQSGGGGASPLALATAPGFSGQPIVGESFTADPPTFNRTPDSLAYAWWRGDPDDGGVEISGETSLIYDAPDAADLGSRLYLEYTAILGEDTVTGSVATEIVGARVSEDWSDYEAGDTKADLLANGWTQGSAQTALISLVANAAAPAGLAIQINCTSSSTSTFNRADAVALLADNSKVEYSEALYLIEINANNGRIRFGNSGGITYRAGTMYHQLPGEDTNDAVGTSLGNHDGTTIVIRHRIEGAVSTVWLWDIEDPEPDTPTSQRTHSGDIDGTFGEFVTRVVISSGSPNELLWFSIGVNTPAPRDDRIAFIPASGADLMEYAASTDEGASVDIIVGGDVTFTVEDL